MTYARIVRLPDRPRALERVNGHLRTLLALRCARATALRVGIGFVLQPDNHDQIEAMTDYAADAGVDFLDLRKDEVDVTDGLTPPQLTAVAAQLRRVRQRAQRGFYGRLQVDLGDELVALANHRPPPARGPPNAGSSTCGHHQPLRRPRTLRPQGRTPLRPRRVHLGVIARRPAADIIATLPGHFVPNACAQCMPSSRTANSAADKLLTDLRHGWPLDRQPFAAAPGNPDPARSLGADR